MRDGEPSSIGDEDFWEVLIDKIALGRVLPIVGWNVATIEPDDSLAEPWIASEMARRLKMPGSASSGALSLNKVVTQYLMSGNLREYIYKNLHKIFRDDCPKPGRSLRQLAAIGGFRTFLTTTFDPLLKMALNDVRFGGEDKTRVCGYSPTAVEKDLPQRVRDTTLATVYHVLGQASHVGDFVACEDDVLEFILGLHQHMPVMKNLSRDLADPDLHFLILGLNFNDWVTRFFMRTVRQNRLDGFSRLDYIADHEPVAGHLDELVLFFGTVDRRVQIIPCNPRDFVHDLSRRWQDRFGDQWSKPESAGQHAPIQKNTRPVFISYSHVDEAAATTLAKGLQEAGIKVWLDRERLKSGDNFENHLEDAVKKECWPFISLISEKTESTREAYFHKERTWAAKRAENFSDHDRDEYYHPVIIDNRKLGSLIREPREFSTSLRTRLVDGVVTPEFVQKLSAILFSDEL